MSTYEAVMTHQYQSVRKLLQETIGTCDKELIADRIKKMLHTEFERGYQKGLKEGHQQISNPHPAIKAEVSV